MYKIFMFVMLPLLGIGWIGYAIWLHKIKKEEEKTGKPVSERLTKTRSEISDWAQQMKSHTSPREQALERRRKLEAERLAKEKKKKEQESAD